jgi:hypothetical protein
MSRNSKRSRRRSTAIQRLNGKSWLRRYFRALRNGVAVASIGGVGLLGQSAYGANDIWQGNTDVNFGTATNWNAGAGPVPATNDTLQFGLAGTAGTSLVDNLMTPGTYSIAGITFSAGASSYTINPATVGTNGFTLTGNITNGTASNGITVNGAGTVILACTIALWLLLSFPRSSDQKVRFESERAAVAALHLEPREQETRIAPIDAAEESARLRASYGARMGRALEPVIAPLGFDWKIGVGLIGAFAAREVFISTMGVVYGTGNEKASTSPTLREKIRAESYADGRPVYTPLVGLSLMIFFALACQCMSTLAAVRRETRGWKWPVFLFAYMGVLAWITSFAVYQTGRWLGFA